MDGHEIAHVTADAVDKVSDLLDWYNQSKDPNDLVGSAFKLVWPSVNYKIAHLTRITISYTETGNLLSFFIPRLSNKNQSVSSRLKYFQENT